MTPVVLDMDPGLDDALALVLAVASLPVCGVGAVHGNTHLSQTLANAQNLLGMMGQRHLPVLRGSARPLFCEVFPAHDIHGDDGLAGYRFPSPLSVPRVSDEPVWRWIDQEWLGRGRALHLVATGPLTDVARLWWCYPDRLAVLDGVTLMGGSLSGGNVTPDAEFNFYVDPDAAEIVFREVSGAVPVRVVGLDVTRQAVLPPEDIPRFQQFGPVGAMLCELLQFYQERTVSYSPVPGIIIHDALAVAAVAKPDLFDWEARHLAVLRTPDKARGTVIDVGGTVDRSPVEWATRVNVPAFFEWMWSVLAGLTGPVTGDDFC